MGQFASPRAPSEIAEKRVCRPLKYKSGESDEESELNEWLHNPGLYSTIRTPTP